MIQGKGKWDYVDVRTSSLALVFLQNIYCLEVQFCVYVQGGQFLGG